MSNQGWSGEWVWQRQGATRFINSDNIYIYRKKEDHFWSLSWDNDCE